ncbi:YqcI/YcgG family protein [Halobacillus halophilus]|uniref:YqcI/YcgG family protein n=1 Tax=Halobacillus halophilus TaxID=1570 RepID=UPI001CD68CDA|nr:YqcI/YcgG family protein [Halobacillus halophilus]MCA1011153.1 YqcI/YcgG family protein [Halobacillus halophilus]
MKLLTKTWLEEHGTHLASWKQSSFRDFSNMMNEKEHLYPCVPGKKGFNSDSLRFGFADSPDSPNACKQAAEYLKQYSEISRDTGKYASLILFFNTETQERDIEHYQALFWKILNNLHTYDEKSWPEDIPLDPSQSAWEFCFHGEPYFVFCATPAHQNRKSRFFPYLLLAFQPRFVFDEINSETPQGRKLKKIIRTRLKNYDHYPIHPDLKWYGEEGNLEWKQYFLRDDHSSLSKCPFSGKNQSPSQGNDNETGGK